MVEKEKEKGSRNRIKDAAFKVAKATVKAILIYLLYILIMPLVMPLLAMIPGMVETIEVFVGVYIVLMIMGDLTSGTVFQHIFGVARALFMIAYLVYAAGDGVFTMAIENISLTVNVTLFYALAALLSLLGLATAMLRAVSFMSERAEGGTKP